MRRPGAADRYQRQYEVLVNLVAAVRDRGADAMDAVFAPLFHAATDDGERMRIVIDQVASLTDPAALAWHHRLCE